MNASDIPARWVRGKTRVAGFIDGPDESMWHAHTEAGQPQPVATFRMGYASGVREAERKAPLVADLAEELRIANRIIYLQNNQLSTMGRSAYMRAAHAEKLISEDITRERERNAVLARAGVSS
jgi:hypothetical protein